MKIIDERIKTQTYESLGFGVVFEVNSSIYIKTNIPEKDSCPQNFLSVNLRTGLQCVIKSEMEVVPVNANLVLVG
jgi:hypothetical protein